MPESIIRKILNQIKWDPDENISNYKISYLHRGAPNDQKTITADIIKEIKGSFLTFLDETEEEEEVVIPFHRIRKIYNKITKKIIWQKSEE